MICNNATNFDIFSLQTRQRKYLLRHACYCCIKWLYINWSLTILNSIIFNFTASKSGLALLTPSTVAACSPPILCWLPSLHTRWSIPLINLWIFVKSCCLLRSIFLRSLKYFLYIFVSIAKAFFCLMLFGFPSVLSLFFNNSFRSFFINVHLPSK